MIDRSDGDVRKYNKLEQAVQIKSDSKDTSLNKETKSSDVTKEGQNTDYTQVKSSASNHNE